MVSKAWAVACLLAGGAIGYVVGPWMAVASGSPWWSPVLFYLAVGPIRWLPWLTSAAWIESNFDPAAIGDGGTSVGMLQYNDRAVVKPKDRTSAFWSGFLASQYTVAVTATGGWSAFVGLRWPVVGFLSWRWSWRSGDPPPLFMVPAELLEGELGLRERKGLLLAMTLVVVFVGIAYGIRQAMGRR